MSKPAASKHALSLVGIEHSLPNASALSPEEFANLVKRRAYSLFDADYDAESVEKSEESRRSTEADIQRHYEKISNGNDLLPVSFLYEGAERAAAICRINTPTSYGSGILIGPGLLITNNHVLETIDEAAGSLAEFFYEADKETVSVNILPDDLFITDVDLDFTIVACESTGLESITPVRMLRNPATVTRNEAVNIIQHPRGREKEIALQNNNISYIKDRVLHYRTDTEPGSSGSGVFTNEWVLVALHHAGWYPDRKSSLAINEGIRISAIVAHLIYAANSNSRRASTARRVLSTINDTSPYLGFFDVSGLVGDGNAPEVQQPGFVGDRRFADIGFWNIEHFNHSVSDTRMRKVANVVAGLSMDVLGLTEVESTALDRLKIALRDQGQNMDYVYLDAHGTQDLAVLYDVETTSVTLRDDINREYAGVLSMRTEAGKTAFPAGREPLFAHCRVQEDDGDTEFLIVVVHLKAFGDELSRERRRLASNILSAIIEELRERENLPVILGGDFNQELDGQILSDLTDSPDLFTLTADDAQTDAISYVGSRYRSLIDHIIVSSDSKLGQIADDDAAIIRLDKSINNFARDVSDHVPLVLRLVYRDKPVVNSTPAATADKKCDCSPQQPQDKNARDRALAKLQIKTGSGNGSGTDSGTDADGDVNSATDSGTNIGGGDDSRVSDASNNNAGNNNVDNANSGVLAVDPAYYDAATDAQYIESYYQAIDWNSSGLFNNLNTLLQNTHTNQLSYSSARYNHLYPWVDLQPNGKLKSIYNGIDLDAEAVIRAEYAAEERRRESLNRFVHAESHMSDRERAAAIETIESENPFNCEHVVPQSWFNKANPMRSDLHHLFACEPRCNSSRSNYPFFDFADYNPENDERVRNDCGKYEDRRFEPEAGKGIVARATLYFLLRYPRKIDDYNSSGLNLLLNWHRQFPVDIFERHRNKAVFEAQGNRNPLIDKPEIVDRIDFSRGLR